VRLFALAERERAAIGPVSQDCVRAVVEPALAALRKRFPATVRTHVRNVSAKLTVETRAAATAYAYRQGLV
jgi:hypothetical protein